MAEQIHVYDCPYNCKVFLNEYTKKLRGEIALSPTAEVSQTGCSNISQIPTPI